MQQASKELFFYSRDYRKAIVVQEVKRILLALATVAGIASVAALGGIYLKVTSSLDETVSKAVTKHIEGRTDLVDTLLSGLTGKAAEKLIQVSNNIDKTSKDVDASQRTLAEASRKSTELAGRVKATDAILEDVKTNDAWLRRPENAQKVTELVRLLSGSQSTKGVNDLLVKLNKVEARLDAIEASIVRERAISSVEGKWRNLNSQFPIIDLDLPPRSPVVVTDPVLAKTLEDLKKAAEELNKKSDAKGEEPIPKPAK
jgi:prophage DNA circulation protein